MDCLNEFITNPREIEQESMRIIDRLLGERSWSPAEAAVIKRVVHTTGDPSLAEAVIWHPQALASGVAALRRGGIVVTDVEMVRAGVNQRRLRDWGGRVECFIRDEAVARAARETGLTRAIQAMRLNQDLLWNNIVAIGNAPTALVEVLRLTEEKGRKPALIIGVPVGFVGAAEAKDILRQQDIPFITLIGTRGGSTIAATIVNALLNLAGEDGRIC